MRKGTNMYYSLALSKKWAEAVEDDKDRKLQLVQSLALHQSERVKIYLTYVFGEHADDDEEFAFVTSSKEIHLGIGRLDNTTRYDLCVEFEEVYKTVGVSVFVVFFPDKDMGENQEGGLLVSRVEGGTERTAYHLSPAR